MAYTTVYVDAWTLRCMFNWSNIIARRDAGEFRMVPARKANLSKKPNHPQNTRSQHLRFEDRNGDEVATADYYVCPTGPVTAIDPKTLKIGDLRYTVHPNRLDANPEEALPFRWTKKIYGYVMKLKCRVFGPVAVLP